MAALDRTNQVLDIASSDNFRKVTKRTAGVRPEEIERGKTTTLVPFEGLPPLAPEQERAIIDRSLMITDLKVVEDPVRTTGGGVWTFAHLIREMANPEETGISPSDFVKGWLAHWQEDQKINGFVVANRKAGIEQLILGA